MEHSNFMKTNLFNPGLVGPLKPGKPCSSRRSHRAPRVMSAEEPASKQLEDGGLPSSRLPNSSETYQEASFKHGVPRMEVPVSQSGSPQTEDYYRKLNKRGDIEHDPKMPHSGGHQPLAVPPTNEVGRFAHVSKMKQHMYVLNCSPKTKKRRNKAPATNLDTTFQDLQRREDEEDEYMMGVYHFLPSGSLEVGFPDNVEPNSKPKGERVPSPSSLYNIMMEGGTHELLEPANPKPQPYRAAAAEKAANGAAATTTTTTAKPRGNASPPGERRHMMSPACKEQGASLLKDLFLIDDNSMNGV